MTLHYQLRGIKKSYENRVVLDISSLDIQKGEILSIVGPSGSGKSTLLRLLNLLENPDAGEIRFNDEPASTASPLTTRRKITTVFQHPVLLRDTVERNVAFGLRLRGQNDAKPLIHEALDQMGMWGLRKAQARKLSGGEAQRVALARALIVKPEVLLLDEPTANLDPYNISLIEDVIRETNQTFGTTMVLVTHNVFQARRVAHRVALLLKGSTIEIGPTQTFFDHPRDARTQAFVRGEMIY